MLVAASCVAGSACGILRPRAAGPLVPVRARDLPPLRDDFDPASLRLAIANTLPAYERAGDAAGAAAARRLLDLLDATPDPAARRAALADAFRVVRVREPLLLTAYYEPELDGRLAPDANYRYPIYARPPDLIDVDPRTLRTTCHCRKLAGRVEHGTLLPYLTRGEIDAGALAGRGLELAWAADPIQLFMLHIQGSGLLRLADGRRLGVRFAATNGRPYRSIGRTLIARGLVPRGEALMPAIRRLLAAMAPAAQAELLASNERYTFFRLASGAVTGSLGTELTPGRSVATDPRLVRPGTLAYLATPSVERFVVSQDTGGAVTGAHADLFLGAGAAAEDAAGRMREKGTLYLLLPRAADPGRNLR